MGRATLVDLLDEIELILTGMTETPLSFKGLTNLLNHNHEKALLAQWISLKPCQTWYLLVAALKNAEKDPFAVPVLLKLCMFPPLAKVALGMVYIRGKRLIRCVLKATVGRGQHLGTRSPDDLEQFQRVDATRDLCEAALPYAMYDERLFSGLLLRRTVGNVLNVHPSVWNRRVKALFSTQDLSALAKITGPDLVLAYENWKTQMQSRDHFDAMASIHIAASLFRLDRDRVLSAASPTNDPDPVELPPALSKWIAQACELFVLPKGFSTVKATFLRTLKAVVEAISEPAVVNLEMTAMARDILAVVDHESLEEWDKASESAVRKLRCKLLEPDIPPAMMANAFCVLCESTSSRPHVSTRFILLFETFVKTVLLQSQLFSVNEIKTPEEFIGLLVELLPTAPEEPVSRPFISQCLEVAVSAVFDLCRPADPEPKTYLGIEWALLLLTALDKHIAKSKSQFLAGIFCSVIRGLGFPAWWPANLSDPGNPPNCSGLTACPHCQETIRQRLCLRLSRLFTKSAFDGKAPLAYSDRINKIQAQAQMDQATPGITWKICYFGQFVDRREFGTNPDIEVQWPCEQTFSDVLDDIRNDIQRAAMVHVNQRTRALQNRCDSVERPLREERKKSSELRRVLKDSEEDLAALEETHKSVKADFSRMRERHAFLLQRSHDQAMSPQAMQLEHESLKQEISSTLDIMANQKKKFSDRLEEVNCETRREIQDHEFANCGAQLVREEEAEMEELLKQDLESQVAWLREQLDLMHVELGEQHAKELQILKEQFTTEMATMKLQVELYTSFLKVTEKKTDEYEREIKNLELQIDRLTRHNEDLSLQNGVFKEEIGKLEKRNAELDAECANWKDQALSAIKELSDSKEADKKVLEILQKRR